MPNLICRWCKEPVGRTWMNIDGYGYLHLAGNPGERPNCYQQFVALNVKLARGKQQSTRPEKS